MKKIILSILASALWINGYSQRTCGSELNMEQIRRTEPLKYQRITDWENQIKLHSRSVPSSTILIPVVVHVVYNNAAQNISDAQIHSQIQVLNEDFQRRNADKVNTPSAFSSVAGNANVEFKLAKIDPNGNPTEGITRTQTSVSAFSDNDNVKFSDMGGCNAWNTKRYLNIWVCNLGDDLLGYAQFPFEFQTKPNTDGVVIHYKHFGRDGSAESPYDKGRTATHEVGHWLDLRHIWGDDGGSCSGTDNIADTPNQGGYNEGCPSFPKTDHCTNTSPGVMFMNYMDYTYDACMNLFTKGQVERMRSLFDTQIGIRREMQIYANLLTTPLSISGPSSFYNEATYTIENLPVGSSVQWSSSSNCLRLISGQGTATATFKAIFNTSAVITATVSGLTSTSLSTGTITANASYNSDISFDVWNNSSGGYIGNTATGTSGLCPNTTYHFSLVNNSGCAINDPEWTVSPYWTIHYKTENMISINTNQAAGGWISLKARTCCGTSGTVCSATLGSSSDCPNYPFTLSPNPATDEVTLQLMETDEVSGLSVLSTDRSAYEIQLWSGMTMLRSFRTNEPTFQIPMAGLPAGLYFVRVVKDGQTYTQKLIKK
ncbi:M43 family zinc metalloprotease [Tannerella sp.]|uniref:M43 family zinc metalloprotease n=1 Tax=Tannerella sp. TaxID=2382127 RepID=UPI003FA2A4A2